MSVMPVVMPSSLLAQLDSLLSAMEAEARHDMEELHRLCEDGSPRVKSDIVAHGMKSCMASRKLLAQLHQIISAGRSASSEAKATTGGNDRINRWSTCASARRHADAATGLQAGQHAVQRVRQLEVVLEEVERELDRSRATNSKSEQLRQADQAKIVQLESELQNMRISEEGRTLRLNFLREYGAELERELSQSRQKEKEASALSQKVDELQEEAVARAHATEQKIAQLRARNAELEAELLDAREAAKTQASHLRTESARLRSELSDCRDTQNNLALENAHLQVLGEELAASRMSEAKLKEQHKVDQIRIEELEKTVADQSPPKPQQCVAHFERIAQLEAEILNARAAEEQLAVEHSARLEQLVSVEKELQSCRDVEEKQLRQITAQAAKIEYFERRLAKTNTPEDGFSWNQEQADRITSLEKEASELQVSNSSLTEREAALISKVQQLEGELVVAKTAVDPLNEDLQRTKASLEQYMELHTRDVEENTRLQQELSFARAEDGTAQANRRLDMERAVTKTFQAKLEEERQFAKRLQAELTRISKKTKGHAQSQSQSRLIMPLLDSLASSSSRRRTSSASSNPLTMDSQDKCRSGSPRSASPLHVMSPRTSVSSSPDVSFRRTGIMIELGADSPQPSARRNSKPLAAEMSFAPLHSRMNHDRHRRRPGSASSDSPDRPKRADALRATPPLMQQDPAIQMCSLDEATVVAPRLLANEFMPNSSNPYVSEIRDALRAADVALRNALATHAGIIGAWLTVAAAAAVAATPEGSGADITAHSANARAAARVSACSAKAAADINSVIANLRPHAAALQRHWEEITSTSNDHSDAQKASGAELCLRDRSDAAERVEVRLALLEHELQLLSEPPGELSERLPEEIWRNLTADAPQHFDWSRGFSPMHWAAQHGRLDLVEYLVRQMHLGGDAMLGSYDDDGRSPLFYAQLSVPRCALVHWLRVEHGAPGPMHRPGSRRPSLGELDAAHVRLLGQLEMHGWNAGRWAAGYNLLHWAAQQGHVDMCRYLVVALGADVEARDDSGLSALDYADKAESQSEQQLRRVLLECHSISVAASTTVASTRRQSAEVRHSVLAAADTPSINIFQVGNNEEYERAVSSLVHGGRQMQSREQSPDAESCSDAGVGFNATAAERTRKGADQHFDRRLASAVDALFLRQGGASGSSSQGSCGAPPAAKRTKRRDSPLDAAQRPRSAMPDAHADLLRQVEQYGWHGMEWKDGYTLLHWAARKNLSDLCGYFMVKGADPRQRDSSGFTALDYARKYSSSAALAVLETNPLSKSISPRGSPLLLTPVGSSTRTSSSDQCPLPEVKEESEEDAKAAAEAPASSSSAHAGVRSRLLGVFTGTKGFDKQLSLRSSVMRRSRTASQDKRDTPAPRLQRAYSSTQ